MFLSKMPTIPSLITKALLIVSMLTVGGMVASPAFAQEVPSNLQVVGTITGAGGVSPAVNDIILIVQPTSLNRTEGQGSVIASDGTYFVDMAKTQSFNGTTLTALLKKGNATYQLTSNGSPVSFPYSGTFPFPSRFSLNPTIGTLISGGSGGNGGGDGGDGTVNETYDVNGDGVFNQADINAIKAELGSARPNADADVNGDGLVNTRDVINAIKALNSSSRLRSSTSSSSSTTQ
ncbi:MAG: hypothetical protein EYC62_09485 [Alphaproteobacteria bacterium]|nr:MAG: hypothetical protein EYC62_09485 [Alphaproteobacteria bacterium]